MIKVPITYKNFDDEKVTEEHYFHLSKSELIDMVAESDGEDLVTKLERVGSSGDGALIMRTFREIIAAAYGQRVDGSGSQFYKDPDLTKRFLGSLAFDQLLENLLTETLNAIEFINGMMPSGLGDLAAKVGGQSVQDVPLPFDAQDIKESGLSNPMDETGKHVLAWAFREPTEKELMGMTQPQLLDVMRRKTSDWKPPAKV
jgi:hypothetical protein